MTQTATAVTRREELDAKGDVITSSESDPVSLHCVFRFEMEHLLHRCDFTILNVYGDFFGHPLQNDSQEMLWIAKA